MSWILVMIGGSLRKLHERLVTGTELPHFPPFDQGKNAEEFRLQCRSYFGDKISDEVDPTLSFLHPLLRLLAELHLGREN